MNDFQKRLEAAENEPPAEPREEAAKHWAVEVLEDFVAYLNEKHGGEVHARLAGSGVPSAVRLQLSPATRPDERNTALVVQYGGDRAAVLGAGQTLFRSRQAFEEYLVELFGSRTFRDGLRALAGRNGDPAEGYLRFGEPFDRDPRRDVMVAVPADVQRRIADALKGGQRTEIGPFEAIVLAANATAAGRLDPAVPPRWLISGGFVVQITEARTQGDTTLELRGTVSPEGDGVRGLAA